MARFIKSHQAKIGRPPGELRFVGTQWLENPILEIYDYTPDTVEKLTEKDFDKLGELKNTQTTTWINIDGLHDVDFIQKIGLALDLHPLLLEDVLNTSQRPKFEEFDDYFFIVMKMLNIEDNEDEIGVEHISFVVAEHYVLSFQEGRPGDVFNPIRERLSRPTSKVRTRKTDYLVYALIDVIIDNYIAIIESFGEKIEKLEDELISKPSPRLPIKINNYKREINFLRKTIRPVRELAVQFEKSDSGIIEETTTPYLKDLVDHVTYATESIETYQIMLNDQLNIYQTSMSNRLNEILRVLTVFSVVFIPLTFIAGVYGTNFEYFPELGFRYAYPVFWAVLLLTGGLMLLYFRRKRWL